MKKTILIVTLLLMALAAFGVGTAVAQSDLHGGRGQLHTFIVEALAEKLDLTVEDVNARLANGETLREIALAEGIMEADLPTFMEEVHTAALGAAVEAGVITQEQADQMKERGFGKGGMHGGDGQLHTFMVEAFAEKLDLSVEDVNARLADGETLREIALAEGVTEADLPTFMEEVRNAALGAAVEAGVITQEQADRMKERGFGNGGPGHGRGGCGRHGKGPKK